MLAQLNNLLTALGNTTYNELLCEGAFAALQVWILLLMQVGFDCGTLGLSDVGNLLSGLYFKYPNTSISSFRCPILRAVE